MGSIGELRAFSKKRDDSPGVDMYVIQEEPHWQIRGMSRSFDVVSCTVKSIRLLCSKGLGGEGGSFNGRVRGSGVAVSLFLM